MTSHEYADLMVSLAEFLRSRPSFTMPIYRQEFFEIFSYHSDKDGMVGAVKALGTGTKKYTDREIEFEAAVPTGTKLRLTVNRNVICRLVRPAEYDCEPLLSPEEDSQIGGDLR